MSKSFPRPEPTHYHLQKIHHIPHTAKATRIKTHITPTVNISDTPPSTFNLSLSPYIPEIIVVINIKGNNPLLGLILVQEIYLEKLTFQVCKTSSPANMIPRWISQLYKSTILSINNSPVTTIQEVTDSIMEVRHQHIKFINITFITISPISIHPQTSLPQIHLDQFNVITKYHHQAR